MVPGHAPQTVSSLFLSKTQVKHGKFNSLMIGIPFLDKISIPRRPTNSGMFILVMDGSNVGETFLPRGRMEPKESHVFTWQFDLPIDKAKWLSIDLSSLFEDSNSTFRIRVPIEGKKGIVDNTE